MYFRWKLKRTLEKILIWLCFHLPKPVAYWCAIRVGAAATSGKYSNQIVPELTFMEALQRWEKA